LEIGRTRHLANHENCTLAELEVALACSPDQKAHHRLNIIHLLRCGCPFEIALKNSRVSGRTLQLWIKTFNERGIEGLTYRPQPGRPRLIQPHEVDEKILPLIDDPALAGQDHWTAVKLCGWLRENENMELSYPTQSYHGGHVRQNVVGAINPADGQLVSLIVPHSDTELFQAFLDTMAKEVPAEGKRIWLILYNASWHKSKVLNWHPIEVKFLPPCSPDFNPIERLWQYLKGHQLAGYLTKDGKELSDKLETSIRELLDQPDLLKSVCKTHSP
jgi:transposase